MVTLNNTENEGFDGIPMTNASRIAAQDAIDNAKRFLSLKRSGNAQLFFLKHFQTRSPLQHDTNNNYVMCGIFCLKIEILLHDAHRTTGANRSLPDIPKDKDKRLEDPGESISQDIYEATEAIGDHSELYATVQDTGTLEVKFETIHKYIYLPLELFTILNYSLAFWNVFYYLNLI